MPLFLQITFWACIALVVYAYGLYAVAIWVMSRLFGRATQPPQVRDEDLPPVSLLIAAYNEEAVIGDRLENALQTDYPRDRFKAVIASDGSSDGTAAVVSRYTDRGVTLLDYKARRGKSAVLNAAMAGIDTDLVLLSDANTHIDPHAARCLARWFEDPAVGAVCGKLVLTDAATGTNADGLYWKYETFLKKCEGRLGALLGSNGAIYAIRRKLYVPIPDNTIVDDFVIPLLAKQETGCRIIYDPDAFAVEETAADVGAEFRRRSRIGAGGFQAITLLWRLLDPRRGWVAFAFLSHKILRWLCPFFLIGALAANVLLAVFGNQPFYRYVLLAHLAFYLVWPLAGVLPAGGGVGGKLLKPVRLAAMFTSMNLALLVGFWRWLRRTQKGAWERTARLAEAGAGAGAGPGPVER